MLLSWGFAGRPLGGIWLGRARSGRHHFGAGHILWPRFGADFMLEKLKVVTHSWAVLALEICTVQPMTAGIVPAKAAEAVKSFLC